MKINKYFLIFFLAAIAPVSLYALDVPPRPADYVNDYAGMISGEKKSQLNQFLRQFETETSNQIVVAAFQSLENESLEDFSIRLAETWKIGQKGKDNGVILLIFKDDRKVRIEVGYGLEGALPDALAGQIIQNVIAPAFRDGRYDEGISNAVTAIAKAVQGEYEASPGAYGGRPSEAEYYRELEKYKWQVLIWILIFIATVSLVDLFRYGRYSREHRIYKKRYSFWEWWIRFAILLFILNLLFRIAMCSALYSRGGGAGGRGGFSGGGGGFGGGGASGRW